MSRTDNTMPWNIQLEDGKTYSHQGGYWSGTKYQRKKEQRSARQQARIVLAKGEEPEPYRHRRNARWMLY